MSINNDTPNSKLSDFRTFGLSDFPASQGFSFPAEWAPHTATWLSWPHKEASWPGKIDLVYTSYIEFIKVLTKGELVRINVVDDIMKASVAFQLQNAGVDMNKIELFEFATNDAWCR